MQLRTATVRVLVVDVRVMRVCVHDQLMPVPVAVRLTRRITRRVRVLVFALQPLMDVLVLVPVRQV